MILNRSNSSLSLALIDSIKEITKAIDEKQYAVVVFIDLKKPLTQSIITY